MSMAASSHCPPRFRMRSSAAARSSVFVLGAILPAMLHGPAVGAVSGEDVIIERIEIGFDGVYKLGRWTPVQVTVRCRRDLPQAELMLSTEDGDGVLVDFIHAATPGKLTAGEPTSLTGYARFARPRPSLAVRLVEAGVSLASSLRTSGQLPDPLRSTQPLILELGGSIGGEEAVLRARADRGDGVAVCRVDDPKLLPPEWYGYESVDTVVVVTSERSVVERMDEARYDALVRWLRLGGRLVLCAGRRGAEIFSAGNPLAVFSPGNGAELVTQRTTSGLEGYAGATERLDAVGGGPTRRFGVAATRLRGVRGTVESSELGGTEGRLPTIVRTAFGLGRVDTLAFDIDQPPFDRWQGRPGLVARVLQLKSSGSDLGADSGGRLGQVTHVGYEDLSGQLRSALDQFPGVTPVPFSWVASLIALYVLLIGPADYYLLRSLGRMHWTWITFPAIVLGFSALAVALAARWSGDRVRVNQVDVVDVDVESSVVRGMTWAHVYSPGNRAFDLELDVAWPREIAEGTHGGGLLAWQGLPGSGLGGLEAGLPVGAFPSTYRVGMPALPERPGGVIERVPIPARGSKSLFGVWWGEGRLPSPSTLTIDENGLLGGRLENPLSVSLTDCSVVFENWIYLLDRTLPPGGAASFTGVAPRNLEWHLTRRRVVDNQDLGTPWDPASGDVPRIVELMQFFHAAGGSTYAGMSHQYQPYVDLSELRTCGRAILVGRTAEPASRLRGTGDPPDPEGDRQWTFVRVLYPVDRTQREASDRD